MGSSHQPNAVPWVSVRGLMGPGTAGGGGRAASCWEYWHIKHSIQGFNENYGLFNVCSLESNTFNMLTIQVMLLKGRQGWDLLKKLIEIAPQAI